MAPILNIIHRNPIINWVVPKPTKQPRCVFPGSNTAWGAEIMMTWGWEVMPCWTGSTGPWTPGSDMSQGGGALILDEREIWRRHYDVMTWERFTHQEILRGIHRSMVVDSRSLSFFFFFFFCLNKLFHAFLGLRSGYKGFAVTMHEGGCKQESRVARDWAYCSPMSECIVTINSNTRV